MPNLEWSNTFTGYGTVQYEVTKVAAIVLKYHPTDQATTGH